MSLKRPRCYLSKIHKEIVKLSSFNSSHQLCGGATLREGDGGGRGLISSTVCLRARSALLISDTCNYAIWKSLLSQWQMRLPPACRIHHNGLDLDDKEMSHSSIKTNDSRNVSVSWLHTAQWKIWSSPGCCDFCFAKTLFVVMSQDWYSDSGF